MMRTACLFAQVSLFALLTLACAAGASDVPDLNQCSVEPWDTYLGALTCPFNTGANLPSATAFVVTVRDSEGVPWPNALVEILIHEAAGHVLCPGADLDGSTNASGQVTMNLPMGGCTLGGPAHIDIIANTVVIRHYDRIVSPDVAGGADGRVGLADFVYFGTGFGNNSQPCTDYNNDGTTSLADFTIFADCFNRACER
jgi:hypothetical protein